MGLTFSIFTLIVPLMGQSSLSFVQYARPKLPGMDKKREKFVSDVFKGGVWQHHLLSGNIVGLWNNPNKPLPAKGEAPEGDYMFLDFGKNTFTQVSTRKASYSVFTMDSGAFRDATLQAKNYLRKRAVNWTRLGSAPDNDGAPNLWRLEGSDRLGRRIEGELEVWFGPVNPAWAEFAKLMLKAKREYLITGAGALDLFSGGDTVLLDALDEYQTLLYTLDRPPTKTVLRLNHPLPFIIKKGASHTFELVTDFSGYSDAVDGRLFEIPAGYKKGD